MKNQLNKDISLLLTYFNVMILSKAFKLNKALLLLNNKSKSPFANEAGGKVSNDNNFNSTENVSNFLRTNSSYSDNTNDFDRVSSQSQTSSTFHVDYDADAELSINGKWWSTSSSRSKSAIDVSEFTENAADDAKDLRARSYAGSSSYRYDLILFPRVLDLCLNFIMNSKHQEQVERILIHNKEELEEFDSKYKENDIIFATFMKRLLYLLESCNFNIHILIENVSPDWKVAGCGFDG